ncbi:MAG: hypothetical protein DHS20C02_15880 [Micavibrio sp.]|nr:MAG: hypothetical protein DHS20C02_15880 [Micavibrio sp.]
MATKTKTTGNTKAKASSKAVKKTVKITAKKTVSKATDTTMETMMTQGKTQMDKAAQDAAKFNRESTEAFMKFGQVFTKGFEDIMRESAALAQSAAEKQAQFMKEAMSTKTLNEWTEVQTKMAQANFDDFMEGATKISELSVKVMTESTEPFNAQFSEAIKKASGAMAAA